MASTVPLRSSLLLTGFRISGNSQTLLRVANRQPELSRFVVSSSKETSEATVSGSQFMEQLGAMEDASEAGKSRRDLMHEAIQNLATQDLETSIQKYNLEEELFAEIDFARINAFTFATFGGNPAAVVYLPKMREDSWHLAVAREFNISETAFLVRRRAASRPTEPQTSPKTKGFGAKPALIEADHAAQSVKPVKKVAPKKETYEYDLRWFTPAAEVELCGHATLASAHFLYSTGLVPPNQKITFHTLSGPLLSSVVQLQNSSFAPLYGFGAVKENKEGSTRPKGAAVYELDFPVDYVEAEVMGEGLGLVREALPGVGVIWAGKTSLGNLVVELESEEQVRSLNPELRKVALLKGFGVGVTAASAEGDCDYVSRYFAPNFGIDEDPATGSLQCSLAPYWSEKLQKDILVAKQVSERGGLFGIRVDKGEGRVNIQGSAVLVMAGVLMNTATNA